MSKVVYRTARQRAVAKHRQNWGLAWTLILLALCMAALFMGVCDALDVQGTPPTVQENQEHWDRYYHLIP